MVARGVTVCTAFTIAPYDVETTEHSKAFWRVGCIRHARRTCSEYHMGTERLSLKLGVGLRLVVGLSLIVIMMMSVIGLSLLTFRKFRAGYDHIATVALPGLILSSQLERESSLIASNAPAIISTKNQFTRQATMDKISDQLDMLNRLLNELRMLQIRGDLDVDADNFQLVEKKRLELLTNLEELDHAVSQRIDVSQQLHTLLLQFPKMNAHLLTLSQNQECARDWTRFMNEAILTAASVTAVANQAQLNRLQKNVTNSLAEAEQSLTLCALPAQKDDPLGSETRTVETAIKTLFDIHQQQLTYLNLENGLLNQNRQLADRFVMSASNLFASIRHEIDAENTQFQITVERHSNILLFVGCLFGGVAFVILLYVYRSVIRRLNELTTTMQAHVEGRQIPINTHGSDEIAEMAHALKFFVNAIESREAKLVVAKEKADAANQAKSTFLSSMSHELRTPLNGILGYAQILKRKRGLDTAQKDALNIIYNSGRHLLTLINDVLDLAKIEAGKVELYPDTVNLPNFLDGVVGVMRMAAHQKDIRFVYEPDPNLPRIVSVDEKRLRQVLLNVVGNAVKFTDRGSVTLRVRNQVFSKNLVSNALICFEIIDTGAGMTPEQCAKIFTPFEQVGDVKKRPEGTGLGLTITRQLVNLMGGDIQVNSEQGKGSTFWFEISLPVLDIDTTMPKRETVHATVIGYDGKRRTILVVDDHQENRMVLLNLLDPLGFDVILAENGQEGIEQAKAMRPDLILMDLVMPVITGFEAVQIIRHDEDLHDIPIIAISASVFDIDQERSKIAGCQDFLSKPIESDKLFALMAKYLDLEWVYETGEPDLNMPELAEAFPEGIIPPSQQELAELYELTMFGDMEKVREKADDIEQMDRQYRAFAQTVRAYAQKLEDEPILELLAEFIE